MRIGLVFFILGLLLISTITAITPEEKVYFDAQSQKEIAQINAKIDRALKASEQTLRGEFKDSTLFLQDELNKDLRKAIRSLVFALCGVIVITLTLFKIIDLKINQTKAIQNYEKELKAKSKALEKYKKELDAYKDSLVVYFSSRTNYQQTISQKPIQQDLIPATKKRKKWIWIILILIILLIIVANILVLYKKFFG